MTKPIITFNNVSKTFEDSGTQVLKNINFDLEEGKFYTLLGASGSGKSTILNIMAGLLDASSGDIYLDGERINDLPINKRDIHTVFQNYALFPHMTVFENVALDGGMRPNEPVEVVIRPEDLQITLPEEGKLQVKVDTQLFRGVHYEIIAYDELGNEWMIHSTRKAIEGEVIGLDFTPEDLHIMRLNETEEEFDARIEEYVEMDEPEDGLINAIEEERNEENL
ncbi:TPA: ATP-binding cassette domain-containing protein [Streptococcus pyogenes]|nr:ATP-binding cassette domain-containing protein [Streptococcus pyogenes]